MTKERSDWFARQLKTPTVTERVELRSRFKAAGIPPREMHEKHDLMRPVRGEGGGFSGDLVVSAT